MCHQYDNPFEIIFVRLINFKYSCKIEGSNRKGIVVRNNKCNTTNIAKVCPYDFCERWTCCEDIIENDFDCKRFYNNNINFIGGSCIDVYSGQTGTCRILKHCEALNNRSYVNITRCGYDCCTLMMCCPNSNYQPIGISDNSKFYLIILFLNF